MLAAAESEETQKRGIVIIGYKSIMESSEQGSEPFDRERYHYLPLTLKWLPIKIASFHFCFYNAFLKAIMAVILATSPRDIRVKVRAHHGMLQLCACS